MFRALVVLAALSSTQALADDLLFPVDCTLGNDCFIQNYVDRAPGKGAVDFTCGPLSYDGHKGTDIRVRDYAAMLSGVAVRSATAGIVSGLRDGVADRQPASDDVTDNNGRDCGNGVLVTRSDGWQFQYCHMQLGSVAVTMGQEVDAGDHLGLIGQSGRSQFPHLHFSIRDQAGRIIDPFDSRQRNESCRLKDRKTLWRSLQVSDYQPGGALSAGILDRLPKYDAVIAGTATATIDRKSPGIVFWALFFGIRKKDDIELRLEAPDGRTIARDVIRIERNRAQQYRAIGRKRRNDWAPGTYTGTAILKRNSTEIDTITTSIEIY